MVHSNTVPELLTHFLGVIDLILLSYDNQHNSQLVPLRNNQQPISLLALIIISCIQYSRLVVLCFFAVIGFIR